MVCYSVNMGFISTAACASGALGLVYPVAMQLTKLYVYGHVVGLGTCVHVCVMYANACVHCARACS